ncbi:hypothetical protein PsorP6_011505 [Peronosclerospora sorghi]|uniref:Uncharacterized protein n=1 Tax=Peronosclerospora sorghi TaxID=230839 RepID=A0ACC0WJ77_9STRA|nr:hypothetical protein PsorP6_011505 [Peronosclerospora sorghi]
MDFQFIRDYIADLDEERASPVVEEKMKYLEPVASKLPKEVQNIVQVQRNPIVLHASFAIQTWLREKSQLECGSKALSASTLTLLSNVTGKLSKEQISQGYQILQRISTALEEIEELNKAHGAPAKATKAGSKSRRKGKAKAKGPVAASNRSLRSLQGDLQTLSSEFYSLIPHDFGRSLPPVISTMADLKVKLELLELLSNLEISQMLQKEEEAKQSTGPALHPLDIHYNMLNTNMTPLSRHEKEFKLIDKFIYCTHSGSNLRINTILKITRPDEDTHDKVLKSLDNHKVRLRVMLLFCLC